MKNNRLKSNYLEFHEEFDIDQIKILSELVVLNKSGFNIVHKIRFLSKPKYFT